MWTTGILEDKNGGKLIKLEIINEKSMQGMVLDIEDAIAIGSALIETVNEIDPKLAKEVVDNIQVGD